MRCCEVRWKEPRVDWEERAQRCKLTTCAQLLQLCLTLCDPMDCGPSGASVPGVLQGKNTGVGCRALLWGTLPTQGSNLQHLLQHRQIPFHWATQEAWISYISIKKKKTKTSKESSNCSFQAYQWGIRQFILLFESQFSRKVSIMNILSHFPYLSTIGIQRNITSKK